MTDVFLNEKFIGMIEKEKIEEYIEKLREERRHGKLSNNLNMHYDQKIDESRINSSIF